MDTKSRNIKYSYGAKVLAFFLAMALAVSAGVLLASDVDLILQYSPYDFSTIFTKTEFNYTDGRMFESTVGKHISTLSKLVMPEKFEDYLDGTYCDKEEELALAAKFYDSNMERYKQIANERYSDAGYDSAEEYETSAAGVYGDRYRLKVSREFCDFSTAMTKEEFLNNVAEMYDDAVVTAKRNCENSKVVAKNTADSLVNLKYFIRNNVTGDVFSNISEQELSEMRDGWYLAYTADSGIISSSDKEMEAVKGYHVYNSLNSLLDKSYGDNNIDIALALPKAEGLKPGDNYYTIGQNTVSVKNNFTEFGTAGMALLLAAFALSVYLVMVSGRTNNSDEISLSWVDKIPTDIHFAVSAALSVLCVAGAFGLVNMVWDDLLSGDYTQSMSYFMIIGCAMLLAVFIAVLTEWAMHVSRFYKARKPFVKNSVCGKILLFIVRFNKEILNAIRHVISLSPKKIKKKVFLIALVYLFANTVSIFLLTVANDGVFFMGMLLVIAFINVVMLTIIWKYLIALDEIAVAAEKGKSGETPEKIDSKRFPEPMKSIADNLYITQDEMKKAVGEAVRGERMKTDLITNVSHDLKTPLTSIITYVDLLKKCDIENGNAQKYISVLDDKSKRLKRLIDDLVEASKVSSGAVKLNIMNVNLHEMTVQSIAEVEDSYRSNNLEIIYKGTENAPIVCADSQKAWRVIDNLLSNARKYSLPGSRVYVEVGSKGKAGFVSVKNVSKQALNINAEELTQRFVMGDSSRTNEGSGLGLSIAKDLCALQGGRLNLEIDGDLFKATMELPLAKSGSNTQNVKPDSGENKQ